MNVFNCRNEMMLLSCYCYDAVPYLSCQQPADKVSCECETGIRPHAKKTNFNCINSKFSLLL